MQAKSYYTNPDGFRTVVVPARLKHPLTHRQGIMLIGSCFTEHIGARLDALKFPANINPFGIVYHPAAIAVQIERLVNPKPFLKQDLAERDGLWHSFSHHGRFSGPDPDEVLQKINSDLLSGSEFLKRAGHLMITLGSARAYHLKPGKGVVANCHKFPEPGFEQVFYQPEDILRVMVPALEKLFQFNPSLRIIWTVSPVRYLKEGIPGSHLSKYCLLRAIELLLEKNSDSYYFPAYEIFMDDLRDYRFYEADMVHPSDQGIEYVWKQFRDSCISVESAMIMKKVGPVVRAAAHRVSDSEQSAYRKFALAQVEKIRQLEKEYPFLDLTSELKQFEY